MMWLRSLLARVRGVWRADEINREIDDELQFHIDMCTEENVRRGMTPDEARRDALQRFGHRTRIKEQGYELRGGRSKPSCRTCAMARERSEGISASALWRSWPWRSA
jgi:hypothetical protein